MPIRKVNYSWMLRLRRVDFPIRGIYHTTDGMLPKRMRAVHPSAYSDLRQLQEKTEYLIVYSDLYRSFQASLIAHRKKPRLAAFPTYSGHNWGISFDIDVERSLRELRAVKILPREANQRDLRELLEHYGWKGINKENWHFNHSGAFTHAAPWIEDTYGHKFKLAPKDIQSCLNELGYQVWPIDGKIGPQTIAAIREFQADYDLVADGIAGKKTQRLLACFCAEIEFL